MKGQIMKSSIVLTLILSLASTAFAQDFEFEAGYPTPDLKVNDDGSMDLYFGPKRPEGSGSNWVQTNPNKGWFVLFRFFGPERIPIMS